MGMAFSIMSGGKPWAVIVIGTIWFLFLLVLILLIMYPRHRG